MFTFHFHKLSLSLWGVISAVHPLFMGWTPTSSCPSLLFKHLYSLLQCSPSDRSTSSALFSTACGPPDSHPAVTHPRTPKPRAEGPTQGAYEQVTELKVRGRRPRAHRALNVQRASSGRSVRRRAPDRSFDFQHPSISLIWCAWFTNPEARCHTAGACAP